MAKKGGPALVILIVAGLLCLAVVAYIVLRSDAPFAHAAQWLSGKLEGFSVGGIDTDVPQCPRSYKFFNDARGDSFCCRGTVDPFSHTCSSPSSVCGMKPGKAPLCADIVRQEQARLERELCPRSLSNHAAVGKCCASPSVGGNCTPTDNADTRRYCVTEGALKPGETRCISLRLMEEATCPKDFEKYPMNLAGDVTGPICHNLKQRSMCYPENVIDELQRQGHWKTKHKKNWYEACGVWSKVNIEKDLTMKVDYTDPFGNMIPH